MSSAAILMGGRATRFGGRDKGALVFGGRSILERQLAELARLTDDVLLVGAADPGEPGPRRSGHVSARFVADRVPNQGPLGGLDAALAAARDNELVVVACDMPFVTAALLAHFIALTPNHDIVVPRTERGYHPLCAVYTRGCQAAIARRLEHGRLALSGLFEDVRVRVVTGPELDAFGAHDHLLANVNTETEYEELEARQGHPR